MTKLCIDCRHRNEYNDCKNPGVVLEDDINMVNGTEWTKTCWIARYNSNCGVEGRCFEQRR